MDFFKVFTMLLDDQESLGKGIDTAAKHVVYERHIERFDFFIDLWSSASSKQLFFKSNFSDNPFSSPVRRNLEFIFFL